MRSDFAAGFRDGLSARVRRHAAINTPAYRAGHKAGARPQEASGVSLEQREHDAFIDWMWGHLEQKVTPAPNGGGK
jgi:hypothetical protein